MKRNFMHKLVMLLILCQFSLISFGQNFKTGLKGTLGGSFFKNSTLNQSIAFSYSIGGFANYSLNKTFSLQAELLFTRKGSAAPVIYTDMDGYPAGNSHFVYNLSYLELPLMIKLSSKGEKSRVYLMSGFAPALFLGGNARLQGFAKQKLNNINAFDIGWISCAGVEYNIGKLLSFVELRFNDGLVKIINGQNYKNFTYGLSTGLRF